jgi:hypothetical protein
MRIDKYIMLLMQSYVDERQIHRAHGIFQNAKMQCNAIPIVTS